MGAGRPRSGRQPEAVTPGLWPRQHPPSPSPSPSAPAAPATPPLLTVRQADGPARAGALVVQHTVGFTQEHSRPSGTRGDSGAVGTVSRAVVVVFSLYDASVMAIWSSSPLTDEVR